MPGRSRGEPAHENPAPSPAMRILIASDNHVGYAERDIVRGGDSFESFDEVLRIANAEDADLVLLAGDLFHDSKPSQNAMFQVIRSLRLNCLGNKPCEVEVLADDPVIGHDKAVQHVNTQDYNLNVALPVYSIHGNHDDPTGFNAMSALEILQAAGLVNHFGRVPETNEIVVRPILMQKGNTRLALYGLSNVREERLHRNLKDGKVSFMRPSKGDRGGVDEDWINILAVHQNHHAHSATNFLPESALPDWFDLIVWGHEHECLIEPRRNEEQGFSVCQPGSSVATSLCPGEAQKKHVGLLTLNGSDFDLRKIPLQTVRPFVMKEFRLIDEIDEDNISSRNKKSQGKAAVIELLIGKVDQAIEEAVDDWLAQPASENGVTQERSRTDCPLPLIRIRVDYTKDAETGEPFEIENPQRFSQRFLGRVANPNDVVQFHLRKKPASKRVKTTAQQLPDHSTTGEEIPVSKLVKQFLEQQSLKCLPETELDDAVTKYVEKDDKDAVKYFVEDHLEKQVQLIVDRKTTIEAVEQAIEASRDELGNQASEHRANLTKGSMSQAPAHDSDFDSDPSPSASTKQPKKAAAKLSKATPAARGKMRPENSEEDSEGEETIPKKKAPAARAPPPRTVAKRTASSPAAARGRKRPTYVSSGSAGSSGDDDDGFEQMPKHKKRK